jgi:hypothetical protein
MDDLRDYRFYKEDLIHPNLLNYKKAVAFKKSDGKYTKSMQYINLMPSSFCR